MGLGIPEENLERLNITADQYRNLIVDATDGDGDYYDKDDHEEDGDYILQWNDQSYLLCWLMYCVCTYVRMCVRKEKDSMCEWTSCVRYGM